MTQYSGLFDGVHGTGHSFVSKGNIKRKLSMLLGRGRTRALRELIKTTVDGDVGDAALATHTRVAAQVSGDPSSFGGVRAIETVTDVDRVTTAADVTDINDKMFSPSNSVFVADASGNGGGGKLGY